MSICVIQMGAPKGSSRLLQRIGRANHRLDEPSEGRSSSPATASNISKARAALDAIDDGELDPEIFRPGALDVLAQHIMACACAAPFQQDELLAEVRSAAPYAGARRTRRSSECSTSSRPAAMRCKAYDRFRRLMPEPGGMWRVSHAAASPSSTGSTPASSSRRRCSTSASGTAASSARSRKASPRRWRPATPSSSPGSASRSSRSRTPTSSSAPRPSAARILTYGGARMSMSTNLADRVRAHARRPQRMAALSRRRPRMARGAGRALGPARAAPIAGRDLPARGPPLHGRLQLRGLERAPVARHADHPADGERGPQAARLRRQRLCARLLRARADHRSASALLAPTSSSRNSSTGSRARYLLKTRVPRGRGDRRAGRAPASGQAQDRAAGQLLDRPHLRRAAPLRAAASAAARGVGRCAARG